MTIRPWFIGAAAVGAFATGSLCPLCGGGARTAAAQTSAAAPAADTGTVRLRISGMTCGSCAATARLALQRVPGVYHASVSYDSTSALVRYDPRRVNPAQIAQQLERLTGYRATPVAAGAAEQPRARSR